jgi:tRNA A37 N6-isopentenylltransferase MiaA
MIQGQLAPEELEPAIVTATMRYAKRQMTWFRHQTRPVWCPDAGVARERIGAWLRAPLREAREPPSR